KPINKAKTDSAKAESVFFLSAQNHTGRAPICFNAILMCICYNSFIIGCSGFKKRQITESFDAGGATMRILFAEDERDLNDIITKKLTSQGYSVDSVYDGEEAIDILS